jgi:hypothetical protein
MAMQSNLHVAAVEVNRLPLTWSSRVTDVTAASARDRSRVYAASPTLHYLGGKTAQRSNVNVGQANGREGLSAHIA